MNFTPFKTAVAKQFERMQKHPMFRTGVDKDELWETYLKSFPAGTNQIYRERTEHDCACCKQFIRAVGDAVAIIDNKIVSVWDVQIKDEPAYEIVAQAMAKLAKNSPIVSPFLHYERTAGTDKNFEQMVDGVHTWTHFFVNIDRKFVAEKGSIPTILSDMNATHDAFRRSVQEISLDAVDTVLELVAQNSLYRGAEHKFALEAFRELKHRFVELPPVIDNQVFFWTAWKTAPQSASHIRSTVIGTLLNDLSSGVDLETAVKAFEIKMAGSNYKRPTALITKGMIEKAKAKIEELGLTSALERRYATIDDITVNNVLFADRTQKLALGDVFDTLSPQVSASVKNLDKVEEMHIQAFIENVLPRADSIEVLLENAHTGNLVSLVAPVDPTAGGLFKWPNNFSWSYNGDMADSIKERVKKAGGNVTGDLCCRLAWDCNDDLDLHLNEPSGVHIYYGHRKSYHGAGVAGMLDVDANGMDGIRPNPVENIFYESRAKMSEGRYTLYVNNYSRRSDGRGFEVEIDYLGTVHRFAYDKVLKNQESVTVAKFNYTHKGGLELIESLPSSQAVRKTWGVSTQTFTKVNVIMLSPNYWDEKSVGNKHYFFMLEGCVNDGTARGFFNEFLRTSLDPHRKVFEVVGSKMKTAESAEQLSGLGFSSTQRNTLVCRVKGKFSRVVKIVF